MKARVFLVLFCAVLVVAPGFAQDKISDADPSGIEIGPPESQNVEAPQGGVLTFYGDRATFDAANPDLPCEDWEDFSDVLLGCDAPANSGTSCLGGYNVGDILPGLEVDCAANSGPGALGLVINPAGFDGNASIQFGSNFFDDNTIINLTPAVGAIGFEVACHFGSPSVNVDVYDGTGTLVASITSACANAGTFLGMDTSSPNGIGSITINDPSGVSVESLDNVCFGSAGTVPTMPNWAMIALLVILLAISTVLLLRRKNA